jgi:tetratricopeptide (TPR) repeat protein
VRVAWSKTSRHRRNTMKSPAQRHYHRVMAEKTSAAASTEDGHSLAGASMYELMLHKLALDRLRLKKVESVERKIEVKRTELLPEYADYVAGALSGGRGAQDDVLTTIMLWRIDAGEYTGALDIARYAVKHRMSLADQYQRKLPTLLAEEFAENAIKAFKASEPLELVYLNEVFALTESEDMPDQVRAKLHKAIAYALQDSDAEAALTHLRRALELDERVGVKQDITRLEKARDASGDNAVST